MLKRTLFFANPHHLSTDKRQLKAVDKGTGEVRSVPIEDVGFAVLEHPHITLTQHAVQLLAEANVAVVFCDTRHYPAAMLLPLDTHTVQSERFRWQVSASTPRKKQLWQQTVKAKIGNQAGLLTRLGMDGAALTRKATKVRSGDPTNEEAQVAKIYWKRLFGPDFARDRGGAAPNPALNYGYAVLRAAAARALAGSGLLPTLGIHHRNRYNAFCLADDIMEPYRPYVDAAVYTLLQTGIDCATLGTAAKKALLNVLVTDTVVNAATSPLMLALTQTTVSLVRCFEGMERRLTYPRLT